MAFIERSTIRELISRYKLEPSLRDVYVEGSKDRSLLSWYCASNGMRDVSVREIDTVEVPSSLIVARGLRPGRRGAVITLGLELCEAFGSSVPQVMASPTEMARTQRSMNTARVSILPIGHAVKCTSSTAEL